MSDDLRCQNCGEPVSEHLARVFGDKSLASARPNTRAPDRGLFPGRPGSGDTATSGTLTVLHR